MRLAGNEDFYEQISGEESEGESKFDSFMRSYEILLLGFINVRSNCDFLF